MARTRTRSNTGFFPDPGTDYSTGQEPTLAKRLNALGKALGLHLEGISGARTPAHSVAVGGFANDPHTRGQASDTPGVESVPESTLRRFGLTRPFPGAAEADHIQLLGGARGTKSKARQPHMLTAAQLWIQAGGPKNVAPIMAAISMAESGGKVSAIGGPNSNGTYDYGLWQINSSHSQYSESKLVSDPLYNARAAVAIYRSQGLKAWSTYTSGAYKSFLGGNNKGAPTFGRTRPGGDPPAGSNSSSAIDSIFADYAGSDTQGNPQNIGFDPFSFKPFQFGPFGNGPLVPNPLDILKKPAEAISGVTDFLKWIAWIFHPVNVLRFVEFLTGITIMGIGIQTMFQVYKQAPERSAAAGIKRATGSALSVTPPGRALRVAKAANVGKRAARSEIKRKEVSKAATRGKVKEGKRIANKNHKRATRQVKRKGSGEVPF